MNFYKQFGLYLECFFLFFMVLAIAGTLLPQNAMNRGFRSCWSQIGAYETEQ